MFNRFIKRLIVILALPLLVCADPDKILKNAHDDVSRLGLLAQWSERAGIPAFRCKLRKWGTNAVVIRRTINKKATQIRKNLSNSLVVKDREIAQLRSSLARNQHISAQRFASDARSLACVAAPAVPRFPGLQAIANVVQPDPRLVDGEIANLQRQLDDARRALAAVTVQRDDLQRQNGTLVGQLRQLQVPHPAPANRAMPAVGARSAQRNFEDQDLLGLAVRGWAWLRSKMRPSVQHQAAAPHAAVPGQAVADYGATEALKKENDQLRHIIHTSARDRARDLQKLIDAGKEQKRLESKNHELEQQVVDLKRAVQDGAQQFAQSMEQSRKVQAQLLAENTSLKDRLPKRQNDGLIVGAAAPAIGVPAKRAAPKKATKDLLDAWNDIKKDLSISQ